MNFIEEITDEETKNLLDAKMKILFSKNKYNNQLIDHVFEDEHLE